MEIGSLIQPRLRTILARRLKKWTNDSERDRRRNGASDAPGVIYGRGRPSNSRDRNERSRSDRFHMDKRRRICEVADRLARTQNTVTYADIGRVRNNFFFMSHNDMNHANHKVISNSEYRTRM